ncbi:MAG TPA: hypothetical protein VGY48_11775 [Vicinamibacterales bacterium]|nr:hypothetical protein [Vicinamibacterales bacterium]
MRRTSPWSVLVLQVLVPPMSVLIGYSSPARAQSGNAMSVTGAVVNTVAEGEFESQHYWAFQPGGGVDVALTDRFAIRLGADYLVGEPWHAEAWRIWNVRFVTGLTYKL